MKESLDYDSISRSVINFINKARKDPNWVADELIRLKKYYKDKQYRNSNYTFNVLTEEGFKAVEEAIHFLRNDARPVPELTTSDDLCETAKQLVEYIGPKGLLNHDTDDLSIENRTKNKLSNAGQVSENVSFGWSDPKEIVLQLIIDDGVNSRGHRNNIYDEKFKTVGVFTGAHKVYMHCCVIDFHGDVSNDEINFEKYMIDSEDWPENAVSLKKHLNSYTQDNKKIIKIIYVFTLTDGTTSTRSKEIIENTN